MQMRSIERRQWSLSWAAIAVTLVLTAGIASFAVQMLHHEEMEQLELGHVVHGLVGAVLLFDVYVIYQQYLLQKIRRQLLEREQFFQLINDNAADMIAVVDADGKRLYNSPSYQRILGYTPEELETSSSLEQIHPDDRQVVEQAVAEARRTGVGRRIEYRMRHKDGTWVYIESTASVIHDSNGKLQQMVIVNRDIGERRRLEQQLHQSQKMDAIGRLSGGVAHDFNNLLGVIIGYGEILEERIPETDELRASVDQILKAGRRASSLTRQLLAFSRQQVLEPKILVLNSVVSDMQKMLHRLVGEDMELAIDLEPDLGATRSDQNQIEQVMNARDAMPNGGRVLIQTSNFHLDEEFAARYAYPVVIGDYVMLTVSDNGEGMDLATQQRIFEPFFTTKEKDKGTGLGLSTVYGVVKQSGGYIDVISAPNKGATFNVYLPRVAQAAAVAAEARPVTARGTETILLVEDEDSLRALAKNLLQLNGYTVIEAANGAEALRISDKTSGTIHLLLTDVVMPGINGRTLADQLRPKRPGMRVAFMSGYTGQRVGQQEVIEPGSIFIQKPFTREQLCSKVREALDSPAPAAAPSGAVTPEPVVKA